MSKLLKILFWGTIAVIVIGLFVALGLNIAKYA